MFYSAIPSEHKTKVQHQLLLQMVKLQSTPKGCLWFIAKLWYMAAAAPTTTITQCLHLCHLKPQRPLCLQIIQAMAVSTWQSDYGYKLTLGEQRDCCNTCHHNARKHSYTIC
jgi:hypothetical protein